MPPTPQFDIDRAIVARVLAAVGSPVNGSWFRPTIRCSNSFDIIFHTRTATISSMISRNTYGKTTGGACSYGAVMPRWPITSRRALRTSRPTVCGCSRIRLNSRSLEALGSRCCGWATREIGPAPYTKSKTCMTASELASHKSRPDNRRFCRCVTKAGWTTARSARHSRLPKEPWARTRPTPMP
jgi:hypothetical protein